MDSIVYKKYVVKPLHTGLTSFTVFRKSLLSLFFVVGGIAVYAQEKKDSVPVTDTVVTSKKALGEVVVTALGVKRAKRDLTFSSQEIKGEDLLRTKEPNLVNALAGKVSGVQITSSSGTPGASSRIVIRGAISPLGDNQALFVVDGVPINNDETSNVPGGAAGSGSNRLVDIDPSIIESMNVLKGAAATALYGSAGARGVVIITTKSGGMNKQPVITMSTDLSFDKGLFPEKQTAYSQGEKGVFFDGETQKTNASWGVRMDTLKINGKPAPKYNPYDFFKTGVGTNNNLSISGGNGASSYFMSYSYFDQKGIVPKNEFKRHSIFFKYTTKVYKQLTTTFQIEYSNSNQNRLPEGASNGPLFVLLVQPVSWNPYPYLNPDGSQRLFRYSRNAPLWGVENMNNHSTVNRFLPVFTANYTATPWLTVTERVGADIYSEQTKYTEAPSKAISLQGKIIDQTTGFRQFNHDLIVNAHKEFNKFDVSLLLGNNLLSTYSQTHNITGSGVKIDDFGNVSATGNVVAGEAHYQNRKVGFYAQANIDYNRFLILSLTGRYDGSSVLESSKRFYPYGSAAMGFVFSEFFSPELSDKFSFGKVRISYANVGNEQVGPYALTTPYILAQRNGLNYPFQDQSGFLLNSTLGNPHLKNERLNETEIGLEMKFLHNRISFEGSYFYKKLHDGIIPGVSISNATGFGGTTVNTAKVENRGIELLLDASPVRTKNFSWDLSFNYTRIRNKVLALYPGLDQLGRLIIGQPYNVFFGARYERNDKGELMIDANGMPVVADKQGIVGNVNPDWLAGINNTFRYKQLSLSFFFDMKKGGDVQNDVEAGALFYGTAKVTENRQPMVIKGISVVDNKPNTVVVDAQKYYQSRQYESTIQDGTYIKLRNVSLAYDLKSKFLQHTFFKSALVSVTGRNLWIYSPHFTGADPEVSSYGSANGNQGIYAFSTPTSRSYTFSLKLSF
ncbi:TonB-linked outer membrane protein, SusC/RagA family [Chitinophaga sp. CF118]|uniref:SusC/RagA family TonB-linked outer membrane protein n=1 Tax=Chitinophaga sp. CF118 TaxID=1884367 RepID=UPI0008E5E609|nr:SusC/RagA family TonB-linked outer membrane protein [Chitinophaga sp. CF118]SFD61605.1 TonB-linked outer membrane protein, SusC/RagA family [Chitinophaga sp. CF118]